VATCLILVTASATWLAEPRPPASAQTPPAGLDQIDHLIFIVQENRSFDQYFGTYPGADGLHRGAQGRWQPCIPNPFLKHCSRPYHQTSLLQQGGPHDHPRSVVDVNGGKMNGFIRTLPTGDTRCWITPSLAGCRRELGPQGQPDVMSFHTRNEIPNYWYYADHFVLQDHLFAPTDSWTLPSHLFLISGWSALCSDPNDGMSCTSNISLKDESQIGRYDEPPVYAWTDITHLLDAAGVSWGYYVDDHTCLTSPCHTTDGTAASRDPLVGFTTVRREDHTYANIQPLSAFYQAVQDDTLPQVSWIVPGAHDSEHPISGGSIANGQAYVTKLINAVGRHPAVWGSTAIFLTWDDWGGFYDGVRPPSIDPNGYGIRVPGLLISPYAKAGTIDPQTLSFDAYLKLIEDRFLGGQRLDPLTDGRPDARPTVREDVAGLGDLSTEFDFTQTPLDPPILDPRP
jgi:phospholipase C